MAVEEPESRAIGGLDRGEKRREEKKKKTNSRDG
jgi:hypothetical protein